MRLPQSPLHVQAGVRTQRVAIKTYNSLASYDQPRAPRDKDKVEIACVACRVMNKKMCKKP